MSNLVGRTILGQFRIDAFVASGGMGAVYRVWDLKRGVPLAMKVLHAELSDDPSIFKRFEREGRALQRLAHPNIVPFYGIYNTADFPFILERYIDGPTLKDILKEIKRPMALEEAVIYLKAICAALGYSHANGVVHCDVKPGNVMVDRGGSIYLTDFGVARHAESTTTTLAAAGTAAYMAPEQIRSGAVSSATDVYALGVMLYEMLAGQRPFRGTEQGTERGGETANERIRYAHLNLPAPDPRLLVPSMPEALANVICRSLNKDAAQRYASAHEFLDAVCRAAGKNSEQIADHTSLPARIVEEQAPASISQTEGAEAPRPPSRNHRTAWLLGGGVVFGGGVGAVLIAIILLVFFRPGGPANPRPTLSDFPSAVAPSLGLQGSKELTVQAPTLEPPPTYTPLPTYTPFPTYPPAAPPAKSQPSTDVLPDQGYGTFRVKDKLPNVTCRSGPGSSNGDVTTVHGGQSFAIVAYNHTGWWKVSINIPGVRADACWLGAATGTWSGNYDSAPISSE